jgi:hypothetical protein
LPQPAALLVLLLIVGTGLSNWRGSGFRADGPELPRLRNVLALKAGMAVADVGTGNGELTVALAAEVGASGRVYANDLDLGQVGATVAAAGSRMSRSCSHRPATRHCRRIAATPLSCVVCTTI